MTNFQSLSHNQSALRSPSLIVLLLVLLIVSTPTMSFTPLFRRVTLTPQYLSFLTRSPSYSSLKNQFRTFSTSTSNPLPSGLPSPPANSTTLGPNFTPVNRTTSLLSSSLSSLQSLSTEIHSLQNLRSLSNSQQTKPPTKTINAHKQPMEYFKETLTKWSERKKPLNICQKTNETFTLDHLTDLLNTVKSSPDLGSLEFLTVSGVPQTRSSFLKSLSKRQDTYRKSHPEMSDFKYLRTTEILLQSIGPCSSSLNVSCLKLIYSSLKTLGHQISPRYLSTFLYVFQSEPELINELGKYYNLIHKADEKITSSLIKNKVLEGDVEGAREDLERLKEEKGEGGLRLRTVQGIFLGLMEEERTGENVFETFEFFRYMVKQENVLPSDVEYMCMVNYLLEVCEEGKEFVEQVVEKIGGVEGYEGVESLDEVVDRIFHEMKDLTLSISPISASLAISICSNSPRDVGLSTVSSTNSLCSSSSIQLSQLLLSPPERSLLSSSLITMADTNFKIFTQNNPRATNSSYGLDQITLFETWLKNTTNPKYTCVLDAANIGYFQQNHPSGRFNYPQIAAVALALEDEGEVPLIILPKKYASKSFHVHRKDRNYTEGVERSNLREGRETDKILYDKATGKRVLKKSPLTHKNYFSQKQTLTTSELQFLKTWTQKKQLYIVPGLCLDDYYWLLAGVVGDLDLVSNDLLRDHNVDLQSSTSEIIFHKWVVTKFIGYGGLGFAGNEGGEVLEGENDNNKLLDGLGEMKPVFYRPERVRTSEEELSDELETRQFRSLLC
ncbi:hypothetical protein TL16_g03615 [Triparma laevis f. inornata]|uniref:Uncharacterized protein n=2 Tax=Triparma laevis TaxID=1534972 RepID=A0A9W7KU34_9STRA|nr:hypothetical protein TL16_g03615 [Triparma laevis f. inornata]GMI11376.1 hypothetical protein TrLO_g7786 [Triparma laevis f. longispina]